MKRRISSFFLITLAFILGVSSGLSCGETDPENDNTDWDWYNCPGGTLARDIAVRLEDLPPGWLLSYAQAFPSCEELFDMLKEASVYLNYVDEKPWNDPVRSASSMVLLRWEEEAVTHYFQIPENWVSINMTGTDEAYLGVQLEDVYESGEWSYNCTVGAAIRFRKGLYDVEVRSYNRDLRDKCIQEGEEVDAEVAFVMDLATKVTARIP